LSWARLGLQHDDLEWFLALDSVGQAYIRTPAFEASVRYTSPATHLASPSPMLHSPNKTSFHPERGIGQGDTPSTLLFVAVFDILLTLLDSANTGIPHAYADDLAHIATSLHAQQLQADLVSAFCLLTGLEIASAKVEAITLNGQHLHDNETLVVHDWRWSPHLVIQSNDSFWTRYLGVFLDRSACDKHFQMAREKFKQACKFLLLRHAPPNIKRLIFILCILPCIRYPAGLAPWTLQQYRDLDKIPYQLLKQIYGLRHTFPQALIYTPVALGGCGGKSISDSIQLTKWKYLHSSIHLGGLAKSTANDLLLRGSTTPRSSSRHTCYTDSLLQWATQIGLSLHRHISSPAAPQIQNLRALLAEPSLSPIQIFGDGSFTLRPATCLEHLTTIPADLRTNLGNGATGLTITRTTPKGTATNIHIRLASPTETCLTTPLFHELLSICFASSILPPTTNADIYSDSKQALKLAQQSLANLAPVYSHLPCGPILQALQSSPARPHLHWVRSHPEHHTLEPHWTTSQRGIHRVDLLAKLSSRARTIFFPQDHVYLIDLNTALDHLIPSGTWIWQYHGQYTFRSIGSYAAHYHHREYLAHRDINRRLTGPTQLRWSSYNFALAAYITSSSRPKTPRTRGRVCKHLYDWTGHMQNLSKGIQDPHDRLMASKCPLCSGLDTQIHSFTACNHPTLIHLRQVYRPAIDTLIQQTQLAPYPIHQRWIPPLFRYIQHHLWNDDELSADIWSGRWSPTMFRAALGHLSDIIIPKPDAQVGRTYLRSLTTKLHELRQLIFKARTRLIIEQTRGRQAKRTRQLQLPHMIQPMPTPRQPKRRSSPNDILTGPIRKKSRHFPPPELPQTPLSRRPRSHGPYTYRQLTPQPPLLHSPHWTALGKRHRSPLPSTPHSSMSTTATPPTPRKRLRNYLNSRPPRPPPLATHGRILEQSHLHSTNDHSLPTSSTSPFQPHPQPILPLPFPTVLPRLTPEPTSIPPPTRRKRSRQEPPTPILRLPRRNGRTRNTPPHPRTTPPSTTSRPSKRPNLNIIDQPPLLTSTYWYNLQSRQDHLPPQGETALPITILKQTNQLEHR
jgi:hypothetical protein